MPTLSAIHMSVASGKDQQLMHLVNNYVAASAFFPIFEQVREQRYVEYI